MNLTRLFVMPPFLFAAAGSVVSCGSVEDPPRSARASRPDPSRRSGGLERIEVDRRHR